MMVTGKLRPGVALSTLAVGTAFLYNDKVYLISKRDNNLYATNMETGDMFWLGSIDWQNALVTPLPNARVVIE